MEERRRTQSRTRINLPIIASNPPISDDARITNISTTGAFISTLKTLPVDSALAIDFQLNGDSEAMSLNARVIRRKKPPSRHPGAWVSSSPISRKRIKKKLTAFIEQNT